ncbi:hypothetical protein BLNAU_207 [Blattamonas nauphoetae]|uniref:Uncharacterized protein n=1 Tax=Blattamonas nauphoetae TaxID=2049346 RepID=A0ABQ9YMB9_9EUKA|nr:hypothetical protein BLNAU_207 [Blattamonas nauphoetae]
MLIDSDNEAKWLDHLGFHKHDFDALLKQTIELKDGIGLIIREDPSSHNVPRPYLSSHHNLLSLYLSASSVLVQKALSIELGTEADNSSQTQFSQLKEMIEGFTHATLTPTYLTSHTLLRSQLEDPHLRITILTQLLVLLHFLAEKVFRNGVAPSHWEFRMTVGDRIVDGSSLYEWKPKDKDLIQQLWNETMKLFESELQLTTGDGDKQLTTFIHDERMLKLFIDPPSVHTEQPKEQQKDLPKKGDTRPSIVVTATALPSVPETASHRRSSTLYKMKDLSPSAFHLVMLESFLVQEKGWIEWKMKKCQPFAANEGTQDKSGKEDQPIVKVKRDSFSPSDLNTIKRNLCLCPSQIDSEGVVLKEWPRDSARTLLKRLEEQENPRNGYDKEYKEMNDQCRAWILARKMFSDSTYVGGRVRSHFTAEGKEIRVEVEEGDEEETNETIDFYQRFLQLKGMPHERFVKTIRRVDPVEEARREEEERIRKEDEERQRKEDEERKQKEEEERLKLEAEESLRRAEEEKAIQAEEEKMRREEAQKQIEEDEAKKKEESGVTRQLNQEQDMKQTQEQQESNTKDTEQRENGELDAQEPPPETEASVEAQQEAPDSEEKDYEPFPKEEEVMLKDEEPQTLEDEEKRSIESSDQEVEEGMVKDEETGEEAKLEKETPKTEKENKKKKKPEKKIEAEKKKDSKQVEPKEEGEESDKEPETQKKPTSTPRGTPKVESRSKSVEKDQGKQAQKRQPTRQAKKTPPMRPR